MARDRFAIDTNVYIDALRDGAAMDRLKAFRRRAGPRIVLAGVVAMELRAGARTAEQRDALDTLLSLYMERGQVIGTSFETHWEAGRVLATLASGEYRRTTLVPSLVNDAALAAACRDAQVVLITSNAKGFTAIQGHLRGFRFLDPWPLA